MYFCFFLYKNLIEKIWTYDDSFDKMRDANMPISKFESESINKKLFFKKREKAKKAKKAKKRQKKTKKRQK